MEKTSDFRLAIIANACTGAAALRERLVAHGLDSASIARLVHTNPLTLARAVKTGATPRGLLVGLSVLTAVIDRLATYGVGMSDLLRTTLSVDQAIADVAAESPVAAEMLMRVCELQLPGLQMQLTLSPPEAIAA